VQQRTISNKKVVLVTNASILGEEIIQHGLNLSRRMDASLEILHLLAEGELAGSAQLFRENLARINSKEPVGYIPVANGRGVTTETVEYAKNRRNIFCVILSLQGEGTPKKKGVRQEKFKEVTQLLNCPVVLYTDSSIDK
jgi:hypothetical protein